MDEVSSQKSYTILSGSGMEKGAFNVTTSDKINYHVFNTAIIMADFSPSGINHMTIRVNDIERAEEFYGDILGFELVRKMGKSMAVYRVGSEDTLVLVEAETSYDPSSRDYRVDHFGFYLESEEKVDEMAEYFREKEVTVLSGPANRKRGRFVFISDPDGNMIEFFYEEDEE